jgi:type I restriction enzyme S subunit
MEKYWNGDVPWMASGDVNLKRIADVPKRITQLGLRSSNATLVDPPAVAIGLAGQGKTRGTVALVLCRLCTNQSVALITGHASKVATEYLLYNLEFRYEELRSRSAGDGRAGLSKQLIEQIPVPLPPLCEQNKIAEILSTVDRAIEQTDALISKQERIKTGLMQDLLTRGIDEHDNLRSESTHVFKNSPLGRIPLEWQIEPFGEACDRVVVGIATSTTKHFREDGVPLLRNQNVVNGQFDLTDMLFITPQFSEVNKSKKLRIGDLVTMRTGYPGRTAVATESMRGWQTFTTLISSPSKVKYLSDFICLQMNSHVGRKQIATLQGGGAQQNLNVGWVVNMQVLHPSLDEQRRIVALLNAVDGRIASGYSQLKKLHVVKTALMQDLLTGKKRVTPLLRKNTNH